MNLPYIISERRGWWRISIGRHTLRDTHPTSAGAERAARVLAKIWPADIRIER